MKFKDKFSNLPKKPGCYIMKDQDDVILYVGKAKSLYNRVRSYFVGSHDAKTTKLVSMIEDFEFIVTSSETEALVLELNLIKKHRPKYNILLTDDKSYPYILLTDEPYPRLIYTRELGKKGKYFGPYPNSGAAKEVVDLLNKIYPLRKCRKLPQKECLYYHIGQCLAPCVKEVDADTYKEISKKIVRLLKGSIQEEVRSLEEKMQRASEELAFEKAMEYLKLIQDLSVLNDRQKMEMGLVNTDVFGYYTKDSKISIQVFHVRNEKMVERSGFLFDIFSSEKESFIEFIEQFYVVHKHPIPNEILISVGDIEEFPMELQKKITIPKKGKKKELVKLVEENAQERIEYLIKREEQKVARTIGACEVLGNLLGIKTPRVIEAFDNSNIQGTSSVSGMVSYLDGVPNKAMYRKFKIKTVFGANDVGTMHEVIYRRYKRLKEENKVFPDLVIVDGGKAQAQTARDALNELNIQIPVIGLAKNEKHKTEAIVYQGETIVLDKKSGLYLFLEAVQEEVHRYAIMFHHQVHSKNVFVSILDQISGIGPVKKREILRIIGSPDFALQLDRLNLSKNQKEEILRYYTSQEENEDES